MRKGKMNLAVLLSMSLLFFCSASLCPVSAGVDIQKLKLAVVKITAESDGLSDCGSGMVVGIRNNTLYVLTACHVVFNNDTDQAKNITGVDFLEKHYDILGTELSKQYDKHLDIAIVKCKLAGEKYDSHKIPKFILGKCSELKEDDLVRAIGHPVGSEWAISPKSNTITSLIHGSDSRCFQSAGFGIDHGSSGGPVFNKKGHLVGMVTNVDPNNYMIAAKMDDVIPALRNWGIETERLRHKSWIVKYCDWIIPIATVSSGVLWNVFANKYDEKAEEYKKASAADIPKIESDLRSLRDLKLGFGMSTIGGAAVSIGWFSLLRPRMLYSHLTFRIQ